MRDFCAKSGFPEWSGRSDRPSGVLESSSKHAQSNQHTQVSRFRGAGDHVTPLELQDILDRILRNPKKKIHFFLSGFATPRRPYFKRIEPRFHVGFPACQYCSVLCQIYGLLSDGGAEGEYGGWGESVLKDDLNTEHF